MRQLSSQELMRICDNYWTEQAAWRESEGPGRRSADHYQRFCLAWNELTGRGPEARDWARGLLNHSDYDVRNCGAILLGKLGERRQLGEAELAVIKELSNLTKRPIEQDFPKEISAIDAALEALGCIGNKKGIAALRDFLFSKKFEKDEAQYTAAEALGKIVEEDFSSGNDSVEAARNWLRTHSESYR